MCVCDSLYVQARLHVCAPVLARVWYVLSSSLLCDKLHVCAPLCLCVLFVCMCMFVCVRVHAPVRVHMSACVCARMYKGNHASLQVTTFKGKISFIKTRLKK